jgi:hypothetical protein
MKIIKWIEFLFSHRHKWGIVRTIWPYRDGWGTWCPGCKMTLDTGLTKRHAEMNAKELNASRWSSK